MKLFDSMVARHVSRLIDGFGSEAARVILAVEEKLQAVAAPGVSWRQDSVDPGLLKAVAGKRRDFLILEHMRLKEYKILIGARPFGSTVLQVSWLLVVRASLVNDFGRAIRSDADPESRYEIGSELDPLDTLDLAGFVDLSKLALKHAIDLATTKAGQPVLDNDPFPDEAD